METVVAVLVGALVTYVASQRGERRAAQDEHRRWLRERRAEAWTELTRQMVSVSDKLGTAGATITVERMDGFSTALAIARQYGPPVVLECADQVLASMMRVVELAAAPQRDQAAIAAERSMLHGLITVTGTTLNTYFASELAPPERWRPALHRGRKAGE